VYQDAVLKSFRMVNDGEHCSTSGSASPDYAGGASTSTSTNCTATQSAYYTVSIGDQIIVLTPAVTVPKVAPAAATRGFNRFFSKDSVLYGLLPGTPVKIRQDSPGKFYVRVGKRESLYKIAAAE